MVRARTAPLVALGAVGAIVLSACSAASPGGDYAPADPYNTAPVASAPQAWTPAAPPASTPTGGYGSGAAAPAAPGPAAPGAAAPGAADPVDGPALLAREEPDLGTIVADGDGFTLYRFDEDTAKPPTTTCVRDCATKWPPVVVERTGNLTLDGVEQSAVGLVERPDGASQLTIAGWPVYRYKGDVDAGQVEGQGVGGTWFAVAPDGKKAPAAP